MSLKKFDFTIEKIELKSGRAVERQSFDEIENAIQWLTENPYSLVELTIESDTFLKVEERKLIYQSHDGIIHLIPKVKQTKVEELELKEINLNQDMKELFNDYFKSKHGNQEPNDEIKDLFKEILNM